MHGSDSVGSAEREVAIYFTDAELILPLTPQSWPELVLASRSPQRRAILAQLGARFTVAEPDYEEIDPARRHAAGAGARAPARRGNDVLNGIEGAL